MSSLFTEQIKERKRRDEALLEDAFLELNSIISGKPLGGALNETRVMKSALDAILHAFRFPEAEIVESAKDIEEQLEYAMRPHGIMWREVTLSSGWYRNAVGPMLARRKSDGAFVALLPRKLAGYDYIDPETGARVRIKKSNEDFLEREAYCFYRGFPSEELNVGDLVRYIVRSIAPSNYILMACITLIVTLIGMITPRITYLMYSVVLESQSLQVLLAITTFSICTAMSMVMFQLVQKIITQRLDTQLNLSVQSATMARIISMPPEFFRKQTAGELSNKMDNMNNLCKSLVTGVFSVGLTSVFSIVYIFQIFAYAPALVVPSLIITALTVIHTLTVTIKDIKINEKRMDVDAKIDGMAVGLLSGVQKIKLSGSEKRALAKWMSLFSQKMRLTYRQPFILLYSAEITVAITLIGELVMYYFAVQSKVTFAEYTAFNTAYGMVSGAFTALVGIARTLGQIKPILNIAEPIMKTLPENSEQKKIIKSFSGNIEFNNVSFRYSENSPYIVKDLSLKIKKGQHVAIVGKTGCGKSTLVRLLLGFEKPERGAIYYDNRDINTIDVKSLRQSIGTVLQDGKLMNADILSNITISAPGASIDDAWEAAELSGFADDIRDMPMEMSTMISEGSGGISGGQKQRLMIARAVVGKPKILIFDEATSALDNLTQKHVSDALCALKCTRIVIAHRLSTIKHCDRILFLEDGRIAEDGTYDELLAMGGRFAELVERQRVDIEG